MKRIAIVVLVLSSARSNAEDWNQFLGPRRDGTSAENFIPQLDEGDQRVRWRMPAGAGYSGAVVVGQRAILFDYAEEQEIVTCVDALSGNPIWRTGYPNDYPGGYGTGPGPRATPTIVDSRVYTMGASGTLQCLDLETGQMIWRRELAKDYPIPESFFGVGSSPLWDEGRILVNLGAGKSRALAALDAKSGKTLWTSGDDTASYSSPVVATVEGKRWALFFSRGGLFGADPANGDIGFFFPWRARIQASVNAATPLVIGNRIFISSSYNTGGCLLELDKGKLRKIWSNDRSLSNHFNTCVYRDGFFFGIDGRQEGGASLRCVELETGQVRWSQEGYGCASLILVGDHLLILRESGELVLAAADSTKFSQKRQFSLLRPTCRAEPALAGRMLYARDESHWICMDLR